MDRLFLDANVLFSAAYKADAGLLQLWKLKNAVLCSSRYALEEATANLTHADQRIRLTKLSQPIHLFEAGQTKLSPAIALPEKDAPILLAAIEARSSHLLTGDIRHFEPYFGKQIEGVTIMLPGVYLRSRREVGPRPRN
jgi:predicted nucleic acid-binding protein